MPPVVRMMLNCVLVSARSGRGRRAEAAHVERAAERGGARGDDRLNAADADDQRRRRRLREARADSQRRARRDGGRAAVVGCVAARIERARLSERERARIHGDRTLRRTRAGQKRRSVADLQQRSRAAQRAGEKSQPAVIEAQRTAVDDVSCHRTAGSARPQRKLSARSHGGAAAAHLGKRAAQCQIARDIERGGRCAAHRHRAAERPDAAAGSRERRETVAGHRLEGAALRAGSRQRDGVPRALTVQCETILAHERRSRSQRHAVVRAAEDDRGRLRARDQTAVGEHAAGPEPDARIRRSANGAARRIRDRRGRRSACIDARLAAADRPGIADCRRRRSDRNARALRALNGSACAVRHVQREAGGVLHALMKTRDRAVVVEGDRTLLDHDTRAERRITDTGHNGRAHMVVDRQIAARLHEDTVRRSVDRSRFRAVERAEIVDRAARCSAIRDGVADTRADIAVVDDIVAGASAVEEHAVGIAEYAAARALVQRTRSIEAVAGGDVIGRADDGARARDLSGRYALDDDRVAGRRAHRVPGGKHVGGVGAERLLRDAGSDSRHGMRERRDDHRDRGGERPQRRIERPAPSCAIEIVVHASRPHSVRCEPWRSS